MFFNGKIFYVQVIFFECKALFVIFSTILNVYMRKKKYLNNRHIFFTSPKKVNLCAFHNSKIKKYFKKRFSDLKTTGLNQVYNILKAFITINTKKVKFHVVAPLYIKFFEIKCSFLFSDKCDYHELLFFQNSLVFLIFLHLVFLLLVRSYFLEVDRAKTKF